MTSTIKWTNQDIIEKTKNLDEKYCLEGLSVALTQRLKKDRETLTPLRSALALKDCFWVDNPWKGEPGGTHNARIFKRSICIEKALAWYRHCGGLDFDETLTFFQKVFAPECKHDGIVSYEKD